MSALLLLPALLVAAAVAAGTGHARRSAPSRETAVSATRRHARLTSSAALVLGGAAAALVGVVDLGNTSPGGQGTTVLLVPITFALVHTVVLAVGESTWPRPAGDVRRARLVRRGLLDAAPRWLVRTTAGAIGLAVVTVVLGAVLAAPDGRSYTQTFPSNGDGTGLLAATASPFPGLLYGGPTAIGLLVLAGAALSTLWVVADRPAVATQDDCIEAALRRASAHRVLRAATAAILVDTGGLLAIGGMAMRVSPGPLLWTGVAVAVLGLVTMLAGVAVACVRAPAVPADAPAVPVG